ncbi:hypothetical protein B484DRAFT_443754 [Ochromonadaceae sp. CCMP2298]|nr:hypothetical protein B484DRAFT_443754 [Ochromonadaceae sp. CCMP2298]
MSRILCILFMHPLSHLYTLYPVYQYILYPVYRYIPYPEYYLSGILFIRYILYPLPGICLIRFQNMLNPVSLEAVFELALCG